MLVIARADELFKFRFAQTILVQIARIQFCAMFEQETSCFAASRSSRLLKVPQLNLRHVFRSQYRGTLGSTSTDQRSMPPVIDFALSTPCCRSHTAASRLRIP